MNTLLFQLIGGVKTRVNFYDVIVEAIKIIYIILLINKGRVPFHSLKQYYLLWLFKHPESLN